MKLYAYIIPRDYGFAPNPYFGFCTLAACKPVIRRVCDIGDWVAGFGGKNTSAYRRLVYLMRVTETLSFNEYWNDERFLCKKPCFDKSIKYCYGDNIYHNDDGREWRQEISHHSYSNGVNQRNLDHDVQTDRVLISDDYWYYGKNAIDIDKDLAGFIPQNRGHRVFSNEDAEFFVEKLIYSAPMKNENGMLGLPFSQKYGFERFEGEH